ncbi:MAG: 1-acyl-sn-glycerol-3-phosphate acyltransferase, partial [Clostridia bacterium]|nr:1-acyl-sn-glycerol-3-phosphate acyltransferase [Clostridia bacterium]
CGKPILPVITDGPYTLFKRTRVIYGDPIYLSDYFTGENPTGEDVVRLNEIVYEKVKKLKRRLDTLSREDKERTTFFDKLNWDFGRIVTFTFNLGLKIRVHCTDKKKTALKTKGAYVIVANHIGLFDPINIICVFYRRRIRILTASVVFENKKFRETMMTKLGCIRLDRDKNDVASFKKCIKSLDEGYPLLVFPEGHIVKGGERSDYKSGAGLLSAMTGAPILPVYIKKREHWYNRTNVYVGDVTHLEGAGGMPAMTMLEEYNKTIAAKIDALRVKAENDEKKRNFNKT